jgi:hypothetical protein
MPLAESERRQRSRARAPTFECSRSASLTKPPLAGARPDLVDEALVDRNRIVDMAAALATVPVD